MEMSNTPDDDTPRAETPQPAADSLPGLVQALLERARTAWDLGLTIGEKQVGSAAWRHAAELVEPYEQELVALRAENAELRRRVTELEAQLYKIEDERERAEEIARR